MDATPHILVVDDDRDIRILLAEYLAGHGFATTTAADGMAMWKSLSERQPNLIVLDLNMPGEDGLSLCRRLRASSSLPIIMLTARAEPVDRIVGLEMGADDYLAKPFEPRELLARIRSVLRRTASPVAPTSAAAPHAPPRRLIFAGWTLDLSARHLLAPEGTVVMLSGGEFRMLKILVEHAQQVLNRDQLLNLTQGRDAEPFDRSVDLQISRLRNKLRDDARAPVLLKTVRSEGYVLAAQVSVDAGAPS